MPSPWSFLSQSLLFQESSQPFFCKNEDVARSNIEKPPTRQPAFQIHVDEPDAAPTKEAEPRKVRPTVEESPLTISNAVARLRQPLATIDIPSSMDVSFGGLEINHFSTVGSSEHSNSVFFPQILPWTCLWLMGMKSQSM